MICPSCQKEIHPPQEITAQFTSSYYCKACRDEAIVWEGIRPGNKAFQWKGFRIYCDYENKTADLQQLYMDIETDTSILYRWATILNLPKIPDNLSKETVEEKIKLYLLFS